MGCLLFIPFLLVDLVMSSILLSAGMMMLPPTIVSLPFKIILFVLVDGWQLLARTLVGSFH
jgi:flagellar biosynthetic protein FliP